MNFVYQTVCESTGGIMYTWKTADGIIIETPHYLPPIGYGLDYPLLVCMTCKKQIRLRAGDTPNTAIAEAWEWVGGTGDLWNNITGRTTCETRAGRV